MHIEQIVVKFILFVVCSCVGLDISVDIPEYGEIESELDLKCHYYLYGESLYSLKWYKGDRQFYQYIPAKAQPKNTFDVPGTDVDMKNSEEGLVRLRNISQETAGSYRCEVITEAPHFHTKFGHGELKIIDHPASTPVIDGNKRSYDLNEFIDVNCTSFSSVPAASLEWIVNDISLNGSHWVIRHPVFSDADGRRTSILGLRVKASRTLFRGGSMKLKCKAHIGDFSYQSQKILFLSNTQEKSSSDDIRNFFPLFFYNSCNILQSDQVFQSLIFLILLEGLIVEF